MRDKKKTSARCGRNAAAAALAAVLCCGVASEGARTGQEDGLAVTVNGERVEFSGQGPLQSNRRVLVPLRGVLERLGAYVTFDAATQTVKAVRSETQINLPINSLTARIGERVVRLDVPARVVNGSTLVPLRFVAEALGAAVSYNAAARTVDIRTSDGSGGTGGDNGGGVAPVPAAGRLSGTVTYRERSALPPGAIVEVKLVDVSRADVPATVLSEQRIRPAGRQVPLPFTLRYDPQAIRPRRTYAVQARILSGGGRNARLLFRNQTQVRVLNGEDPGPVEVLVQRVR